MSSTNDIPAKLRGPSVMQVPPGDERERLVCPDCGFIAYRNPLVVVGSVSVWEDRILMCRRAIEPSRGLWTLPAGYMEEGESSAQGAAREAWEEARARIEPDAVLTLFDLPEISQVQILYRARLLSRDVEPGPESLEVALLRWDEIPWNRLAFPTVGWALHAYRARIGQNGFAPAVNPTPQEEAAWAACG